MQAKQRYLLLLIIVLRPHFRFSSFLPPPTVARLWWLTGIKIFKIPSPLILFLCFEHPLKLRTFSDPKPLKKDVYTSREVYASTRWHTMLDRDPGLRCASLQSLLRGSFPLLELEACHGSVYRWEDCYVQFRSQDNGWYVYPFVRLFMEMGSCRHSLSALDFGLCLCVLRFSNHTTANLTFWAISEFGGGIVQVSAECKKDGELKMGSGITVYHFVESIEEVSATTNLW